ncbi:MAG: hypothetical protein MUC84_08155, partial [Solirubrobacteraceae bacterium]|nr:hypothetical protein [Solirubrobacteraceae bacterium]
MAHSCGIGCGRTGRRAGALAAAAALLLAAAPPASAAAPEREVLVAAEPGAALPRDARSVARLGGLRFA